MAEWRGTGAGKQAAAQHPPMPSEPRRRMVARYAEEMAGEVYEVDSRLRAPQQEGVLRVMSRQVWRCRLQTYVCQTAMLRVIVGRWRGEPRQSARCRYIPSTTCSHRRVPQTVACLPAILVIRDHERSPSRD